MFLTCAAAAAPVAGGPAGPAPPRAPGTPPAAGGKVFTLLYGDDHCFGLVAPEGWVLDDSSGLGSKIRVVLYPKGQKWSTARTVMYVNPIHQDPARRRTLQQVIEQDVSEFRRQSPGGTVSPGPQVRTDAGKTAELRYFARHGGEPEEAVAYVPEDDLVMLLVLSSREPGGLKPALPAFRDMVASYRFVAGNIRTPTH